MALPGYFNSTANIEGIDASDLFALNTMLGTTIEVQVVRTLNRIRDVWDPDDDGPSTDSTVRLRPSRMSFSGDISTPETST